MFEKIFSYRQIYELESSQKTSLSINNDLTRRAKVPIAVIDDEPFLPHQTLNNNGYDIRILGDIKNLSEIKDFNVILCDLQGVGIHLNDKNQGAYLIDEIKRNHPEKFVIAYTGGAVDDEITKMAHESADYFLKKDADVEDWREKLDRSITFLSKPVSVWKRQRYALFTNDVSTLGHLEK